MLPDDVLAISFFRYSLWYVSQCHTGSEFNNPSSVNIGLSSITGIVNPNNDITTAVQGIPLQSHGRFIDVRGLDHDRSSTRLVQLTGQYHFYRRDRGRCPCMNAYRNILSSLGTIPLYADYPNRSKKIETPQRLHVMNVYCLDC